MGIILIWFLSLGHLVVDLTQGVLPVFLPYLAEKFSLSYFQVGLVTLFFNFTSAIIQPVFGIASDKYRMPWLMPLGLFLSGIGLSLAGWVNSYALLLIIVLLSGLGVAAYHPEGSKITHYASGGHLEGTSMAVFAVGGNLGVGLGPMLGLFLLKFGGLRGSMGMLIPGTILALVFLFQLPYIKKLLEINQTQEILEKQENINKNSRQNITPLLLLISYVILRSWIHAALLNYIPFYFQNAVGSTKEYAGFLLTAFLIAGAVGTVLGGPIADKWGLKTGLIISMVLTLLSIYPFLHAGGIFTPVFAVLSGAALISTFSTTVVYSQKLLPNKIGVASGVILGFSVGAGSIGVVALGALADSLGLTLTLNLVSFLPLAALVVAFFLPKTELNQQQKAVEH